MRADPTRHTQKLCGASFDFGCVRGGAYGDPYRLSSSIEGSSRSGPAAGFGLKKGPQGSEFDDIPFFWRRIRLRSGLSRSRSDPTDRVGGPREPDAIQIRASSAHFLETCGWGLHGRASPSFAFSTSVPERGPYEFLEYLHRFRPESVPNWSNSSSVDRLRVEFGRIWVALVEFWPKCAQFWGTAGLKWARDVPNSGGLCVLHLIGVQSSLTSTEHRPEGLDRLHRRCIGGSPEVRKEGHSEVSSQMGAQSFDSDEIWCHGRDLSLGNRFGGGGPPQVEF